jgi:hypothetical protein
MCALHSSIINQLQKYEDWITAKKFHEEHEYVGEHWEKCDEGGPIPIYHYIRKERLGSRSKEELDMWDFDQEIWLGDKLWPYCGLSWEEKTCTEYPADFVEKLKLEGLVKI